MAGSRTPRGPTRIEIEVKLTDLISGTITREAASEWARPWGNAYDSGLEDPAIREVLEKLYAADSPSTDRPYLFGPDDFADWLRKLRGSDTNNPLN